MAENPIKTPLPANLPEDWVYGQTVGPNGTDVGLTEQHGYNYLMQQVNAAENGINALGNAMENMPELGADGKVPASQLPLGVANGAASLDGNGKVPVTQIPALGYDPEGSADSVQSNLTAHINDKSNPHGVTKVQVGLGNVDNTSDLSKPISTATQTALNGKQATVTGGASTITGSNLTANRALVSNGSGKVAVSAVTSTELGYLDGVTSNIQTQINNIKNSLPISVTKITSGTVNKTITNTNEKIADFSSFNFQHDLILLRITNFSISFASESETSSYYLMLKENDSSPYIPNAIQGTCYNSSLTIATVLLVPSGTSTNSYRSGPGQTLVPLADSSEPLSSASFFTTDFGFYWYCSLDKSNTRTLKFQYELLGIDVKG